MICITKVVSRNIIVDMISRVQNFLGHNLVGYEKMVDKAMTQIKEELVMNNLVLGWFRFELTQLTNGAVCVTLYGEQK